MAIRDNVMRRWSNEFYSGDVGIPVLSWNEAVIDNNVIEVNTIANGRTDAESGS